VSKRKPAKSAAWYRAAMLGVEDRQGELSPGLRKVAKGFTAAEGYNLRDLKEGRWTPAMKRKVSMYFHELQLLTGQEKIIIKTKSPKRLLYAQMIGGHDPKYKFKVAFVPGTKDASVEWEKDGSFTVRENDYRKKTELFDHEALADSPDDEVARLLESPSLKKAKRFKIVVEENVFSPAGGLLDRGNVAAAIRKLMAQYDGKRALPRGSGNIGDDPAAHHYSQWLNGLMGYTFRFDPNKITPEKALRELERNRDLQRRKSNKRKAGKRQSMEGI